MYVWLENGSTTTWCSSRMVEIEPVIPHCMNSRYFDSAVILIVS